MTATKNEIRKIQEQQIQEFEGKLRFIADNVEEMITQIRIKQGEELSKYATEQDPYSLWRGNDIDYYALGNLLKPKYSEIRKDIDARLNPPAQENEEWNEEFDQDIMSDEVEEMNGYQDNEVFDFTEDITNEIIEDLEPVVAPLKETTYVECTHCGDFEETQEVISNPICPFEGKNCEGEVLYNIRIECDLCDYADDYHPDYDECPDCIKGVEQMNGSQEPVFKYGDTIHCDQLNTDMITLVQLTALESRVMKALVDWGLWYNWKSEPTFSDVTPQELSESTGIEGRRLRGVLSSLTKKNMLYVEDVSCLERKNFKIVYPVYFTYKAYEANNEYVKKYFGIDDEEE